ncbi:MFS transporter [Mesorhizobium sp. M1050]|uniref:MFS transporter n=1 Tax=Mesorhizobium sp. M1050 TaxID=2957051 RepID=UPI0033399A03
MRRRWTTLAVLFVARAAMAFQFQSVGAVAPLISDSVGASLADIGILIGLYLAPGVALALPGATIGQRYGDKATVLAGLLMMLAGEMLMAASPFWSLQVGGRLISGTGGVLLNVLMTKMVADWFAGREIATAMAIYINSWPAGIAIALMLLPAIATTFGVTAVSVLVIVAIGLMTFIYRTPEVLPAGGVERSGISAATTYALIAAGLIWCLYNVGFAMVFSFGPSMLVERGWSNSAAGSTISVVLWLATLSVPRGGFLTDRTKRGGVVLATGCVGFAFLMLLLSRSGPVFALIIAMGIAGGVACRRDHELADARAQPEDALDRDGGVLHRLLCRHAGWADDRRQTCNLGRQLGRRARFRRCRAPSLPSPPLVIPPDQPPPTDDGGGYIQARRLAGLGPPYAR